MVGTMSQNFIGELKTNTTHNMAAYKTTISQLFRICMEVMTFARAMNTMVYEMELLAMNGVVHAAKVKGGQGKPLLALGEILSDLPSKITPEVRELESWCAQVAKNTARCADLGRHHYQQICCLVATICQYAEESQFADCDNLARLNLTQPADITTLMKSSLFDTVPSLTRDNMNFLADRCQINSAEITQLLKHSAQCLGKGKMAAENIKAIGTTARYLALYICIEAAYLSDKQASFNNLAKTITETIDHLDEQFKSMTDILLEGELLLQQLTHEARV